MKGKKITMKESARIVFLKLSGSIGGRGGLICLYLRSPVSPDTWYNVLSVFACDAVKAPKEKKKVKVGM